MPEDSEEISIELGIQLDEHGEPMVVMIFPEIINPETDDYMSIAIGDGGDAAVFATHLIRAGQITVQLSEDLTGVEDPDEIYNIIQEYGRRLNAPYN